MATLNQIIAIETGAKTRTAEALTAAHHSLLKNEQFHGVTRVYRPRDEEGEALPGEEKLITHDAPTILRELSTKLVDLFDVSLVRDQANCSAFADVEVDGTTIAKQVPVTYLLFLEKKLVDLHTLVKKLPVLPLGESWTRNQSLGVYESKPTETTRTKKITRPLIMVEATDKHPAQVKEISEDIVAGYWTTTKYSSAFSQADVNAMLARVEKLQRAVKFAREQANSSVVPNAKIGAAVVDFVFAL